MYWDARSDKRQNLISQFIPQECSMKEDILMGNLEGKMDLSDLSADGSKITY